MVHNPTVSRSRAKAACSSPPSSACRSREYPRIIYGPKYLLPGHLYRFRQRNVKAKRNLALREFALASRALNASWPASPCTACISAFSGY